MIHNTQHIGLELLETERTQLFAIDPESTPIYDLGLRVVSLYSRFTKKPLQEPTDISALMNVYHQRHPSLYGGVGKAIQELATLIQNPIYTDLQNITHAIAQRRIFSSELVFHNNEMISREFAGEELSLRVQEHPEEFMIITPKHAIAHGYGTQLHLLKNMIVEYHKTNSVGFFDKALNDYVTLYEVMERDATFPHLIFSAFRQEETRQKSTSLELKHPL